MALNTLSINSLLQGAARAAIDASQATTLRNTGVLVEDPRRERPRYFDGRFLAARDLIRDQQYFLTREADLGRTAGSGVGNGLYVNAGASVQSLNISAGQGVTPAGELVLLPGDMSVNLADIPVAEQLSVSFGLSRIPAPPLRSRTGLFILALRPVEFTANPIGAYPTTLTGPRTVEDGDVIEATAIVLVPYQDDGGADNLVARRSSAARAIFTQGATQLASANVLPIAMLALQSNSIVWIDEAMVRRELGADRGDLPGLGFAPRALRLAHLMQYQTHLNDVYNSLNHRAFPAATQFQALPPAGPLPAGVINTADFTQRYFPSEVDVDFSIIPDDELPALVEEALALPPIDFLASEAALDLTAVLILAPVPRDQYRNVMAQLDSRTRVLKPAAPNLIAQRKPLEILQRLRLPIPIDTPDVSNPADAQWAQLAQQSNLWYVRRRNLAYRDDLAGTAVAVTGHVTNIIVDPLPLPPIIRNVTPVVAPSVNPAVISTAATTATGNLASSAVASNVTAASALKLGAVKTATPVASAAPHSPATSSKLAAAARKAASKTGSTAAKTSGSSKRAAKPTATKAGKTAATASKSTPRATPKTAAKTGNK